MVCFFLMGYKGYQVLLDVIGKYGTEYIEAVISEKDNNVLKDYYAEIRDLCAEHKIPHYNRKQNYAVQSPYSIAISWRWLIPTTNQLIIVHDSLLPQYRGFSPLVTALINGDTVIGVTALFGNEDFDSGNIIYQSSVPVKYPVKIGDAIEKISGCYVEVIRKVMKDVVEGNTLPSIIQSPHATYSLWRDEKDYEIDWSRPADYIKRFIDAVGFPYKGAHTSMNGQVIKILEAETAADLNILNRTAGKVLQIKNGIPHVICGEGILKILKMEDAQGKVYALPRTRIRFGA